MFEQKPNLFYHYCDAIILQNLYGYNQKNALNQLLYFKSLNMGKKYNKICLSEGVSWKNKN